MIAVDASPALPGAFDWNIGAVLDAPDMPAVQQVIVRCGCVGIWAPMNPGEARTLVGFARMCYAHECFKVLARVWQSQN